MSANFTGVTFPNQKVSPANDAVVRRAVLADGILTGCDFSYSGSTLTMTAGQLIVCGRQIIHPSSQNWAISEATSGVARLLLTIDITRTSTKDTFDQVLDQIQYATDVNGFPALEQSDINASGTRYQVAACVVSLGPGGVTGIIDKLDEAEGGGAGGVLTVTAPPGVLVTVSKDDTMKTKSADADGVATFRGLKRGEWNVTISQDEKTKSQTVEIETEYAIKMNFYVGIVHVYYPGGGVCTAVCETPSGQITLRAPDTSGHWDCEVPITGKWTFRLGSGLTSSVVIWKDGQQTTIDRWCLYDYGDQCTAATGGWDSRKASNGIITWNDNDVNLGYKGSNSRYASIYSAKKINVFGFNTLCVLFSDADMTFASGGSFCFGLQADAYTGTSGSEAEKGYVAKTKLSGPSEFGYAWLEIAELTGYYAVQLHASSANVTIEQIYLEV